MSLNQWTLNSKVLNEAVASSSIIDTGEGLLLSILQNVTDYGSGKLIDIKQNVIFFETGEGNLIEITQDVLAAIQNRLLIEIRQEVRNNTIPSFYERNGYLPIITIGSMVIPDNWVHGSINITREENAAAQLTFTLYPGIGIQDLDSYEGQLVKVYAKMAGNNNPIIIYTGYINTPNIDIVNGFITFSCSDLRDEQIENQLATIVPYIGYYTEDVFGERTNLIDEVNNRLTTTPLALNFNAAGQYTLSNLVGISTPHFIFNDEAVYGNDGDTGRDPRIEMAVRSRIINKVDIKFKYNYQRLYQRSLNFSWQAPYQNSICDFLKNGYSVLKRDMVESAVRSAGWPLRQPIGYVPIFASGFYNCGGISVGYSTSTSQFVTQPIVDGSGNAVKDSQGNATYKTVQTGTTDIKNTLCLRAAWNASYVWAQNMSEEYVLSVYSSQSQARYGVREQEDTVQVESTYNTSELEKNEYHLNMPAGSITNGPDKYINLDSNISGYYNSISLAIARAQTTIIKSHRDTRVTFRTSLNPYIDLVHTAKLNCTKVLAQGKVSKIQHMIDCNTGEAYTEIEISVSRAPGSATTTAPNPPTRPTYTPPVVAGAVGFESHYGLEPNPAWTGHIGNKYVTERAGNTTNTFKTAYPESFVVDVPAIEDAVRANKVLNAGTTQYNVAITNNLFQITFEEH